MNVLYELIDLDSGNVLADFESRAETIRTLWETVDREGKDAIAHFALLRLEDDEQSMVAMESDLVKLLESEPRHSGVPSAPAQTWTSGAQESFVIARGRSIEYSDGHWRYNRLSGWNQHHGRSEVSAATSSQ